MVNEMSVTRILIVDEDEASFEFCRSLASHLEELPPIELFHARDATEALHLLESIGPDVLVVDDENPGESELLLESLASQHPPIVFCTENIEEAIRLLTDADQVTCIEKNQSLEGIHQRLRVAAALGMQALVEKNAQLLH